MRSRSDRGRRRAGIEAVVALRDVDDDRDSARLRHRLECRDERGSRDDDLVARLEAGREQAEPERVEAARDADAVIDAAVLGECRLEARNGGPVRECARLEELPDLPEQPLLQRSACRREVEERHAADGWRCLLRDHAQTVVAPLPSHYRLIGQLFGLESTCLQVVDRRPRRAYTKEGWHGRRPPTTVAGHAHCLSVSSADRLLGTVTQRGTLCRFSGRAARSQMVDVGTSRLAVLTRNLAKETPEQLPIRKIGDVDDTPWHCHFSLSFERPECPWRARAEPLSVGRGARIMIRRKVEILQKVSVRVMAAAFLTLAVSTASPGAGAGIGASPATTNDFDLGRPQPQVHSSTRSRSHATGVTSSISAMSRS